MALIILMAGTTALVAQQNMDLIIGRWMSTDNNLEVEVFKAGNEFRARVVWFDDTDNKSVPMNQRSDRKNPNQTFRSRKIIGMEVMNGLVYNAKDNEWQDGRIYDASTGKTWNAKISLIPDGCLKVRGFWHVEFLGKNLCFKSIINPYSHEPF